MNFFDGILAAVFIASGVMFAVDQEWTTMVWVIIATMWWGQAVAYREGWL